MKYSSDSKIYLNRILRAIDVEDSTEVNEVLTAWHEETISKYDPILLYAEALALQYNDSIELAFLKFQETIDVPSHNISFLDSIIYAANLEMSKLFIYDFGLIDSADHYLDQVLGRLETPNGYFAPLYRDALYYKSTVLRYQLLFKESMYHISQLEESLLREAPLDSQMWVKSNIARGNIHFDLGEFYMADSIYSMLLDQCKDNGALNFRVPYLLHVRSLILLNMNDLDQLTPVIDDLLSIDPTNENFQFLYHYLSIYNSKEKQDLSGALENIQYIENQQLTSSVEEYLVIDYLSLSLEVLGALKEFNFGNQLINKYENSPLASIDSIEFQNLDYFKQKAIYLSLLGWTKNDDHIIEMAGDLFVLVDSVLFNRIGNTDSYENFISLLSVESDFYDQWVNHSYKNDRLSNLLPWLMDRRKYNASIYNLKNANNEKFVSALKASQMMADLSKWCFEEDAAIISYYYGHSGQYINLIDQNGSKVWKGKPVGEQFFQTITSLIDVLENNSSQIEINELIGPISENLWPQDLINQLYQKIVVIGDHDLYKIPFELIQNQRDKPLIETCQIDYALSLKTLHQHTLRVRSEREPHLTVMAYSDEETIGSAEEKGLSELPGSIKETQALKEICQRSGVPTKAYTGKNCTISNFTRALKMSKYIHLSTHAVGNDDIDRAFIYFRATDPLVGLDTFDVTGDNISNDGVTELLFLSACETLDGQSNHSDGVHSLVSHLAKGDIAHIIASNVLIDDQVMAALSASVYRNYFNKEQSISEALRNAKMETMKIYPNSNELLSIKHYLN